MKFNLLRLSLYAVYAAILALTFSACNEDERFEITPSSNTDLAYTGVPAEATLTGQFATQFAEAMKYLEVRTFVKSKVMLQFDGDYDFLLAFEKDSKIAIEERPEVTVFGELFSFPDDENSLDKSIITTEFIEALLDEEPLLQIHIPELWENSTEDWDESQFIPKIACLSLVDVDKGDLPTFDPMTNSWTEISGTTPPSEVTIVLSQNERIVYSQGPYTGGSKSFGPNKDLCSIEPIENYQDEFYYDFQDVEDFDNCNTLAIGGVGGGGGNPPNGGGVVDPRSAAEFPCVDSDRGHNDSDDQVSFRRFVDIDRWRDANEWFDGEHEIRVHITFRNTSGGPTTLRRSWFASSDDLRTCTWFHCDVDEFNGEFKDVITWIPDIQGSLMNYTWEEVDEGSPITISIKLKPKIKLFGVIELTALEIGTSFTISNNSDRLGESIVEYCDGTTPPSEYNTDWVIFQVRQTIN